MSKIVHPAKYSAPILPYLARYVDGARIVLDVCAGVGLIGQIRSHLTVLPLEILANEIQEAWAAEAASNGCDRVRVGDARTVSKWAGLVCAIVVSVAYGNRMADAALWAKGRKHSTYTSAYRQTVGAETAWLHDDNAGQMQWTGPRYKPLHREIWAEAWETVRPGGRLVLNVANHYRDGVLQQVAEWHVSVLLALGFVLLDWTEVPTARYGFGANADLRAPELVILMEKPGGEYGDPPWLFQPVSPGAGGLWDVQPEPMQLGLFGEVAS